MKYIQYKVFLFIFPSHYRQSALPDNMKSVLFLCLTAVSVNALVLPLQLNLGGDRTPSLRSIETCRKFRLYQLKQNFLIWLAFVCARTQNKTSEEFFIWIPAFEKSFRKYSSLKLTNNNVALWCWRLLTLKNAPYSNPKSRLRIREFSMN